MVALFHYCIVNKKPSTYICDMFGNAYCLLTNILAIMALAPYPYNRHIVTLHFSGETKRIHVEVMSTEFFLLMDKAIDKHQLESLGRGGLS